jgi:hypothetical protein
MQITLDLPDAIAGSGETASEVSREVLEAYAVEKYRTGKISRKQLSDLLQLDYWQTDELLGRLDGMRPYTLADLAIDRKSLATLP